MHVCARARPLHERVGLSHGVEDVVAEADSVKFNAHGVVSVDLKFVPVFDSLAEVYQALKHDEADARSGQSHNAARLVKAISCPSF